MTGLEATINSYFELSDSVSVQLIKLFVFAVLFGFVTRTQFKLERSTYLFGQSLVYWSASLLYLLWADALVASRGDYQILYLIFYLIIAAGISYSLIMMAKARSNDAYGHSNYASLRLSPLQTFGWYSLVKAIAIGSRHLASLLCF